MLTRRGFLKGLLSSVAAAALVKNGVVQPEQVIAEPGRWTIDMGANTWRESLPRQSPLIRYWSMEELPPEHPNCRCVIVPVYDPPLPPIRAAWATGQESQAAVFGEMKLYVPNELSNTIIDQAFKDVTIGYRRMLTLDWSITAKQIQARIDELSRGQA